MKTLEKASWIAGIVGAALTVWEYVHSRESPPPPQTVHGTTIIGRENVFVHGDNNVVSASGAAHINRSSIDDSLIPGIWYCEYSYPGTGGSLTKVRATTEYFENGGYKAVGQMTIVISEKESRYELTYDLNVAGEWMVSGRNILIKTTDIKSHVRSFREGSQAVDISTIPQSEIRRIIPPVEDIIPKGTPERFEVIRVEKGRMRLRGFDPVGGFFEFDNTRQATRFVRK